MQKTRQREVLTLAGGAFVAKQVLKQCAHCATVFASAALAHLLPARARYGYDVMVYVGLARYLRAKQREEICAELREHFAITLSEASISNLCDRFLAHLEALHVARTPALRAAMAAGYALHFDATREAGKGGLMVCLDGWRGWVLLAGRIPTEHEQHLRPLIERTVALFGDPVATMHDLADAGANALETLRARGVPDLVCHYHFLRALGEKLLDTPYAMLRKLLREHTIPLTLTGIDPPLLARMDPWASGRARPALMEWTLAAVVMTERSAIAASAA